MREDELLARVGHRFLAACARVEPYEDWLLREAVAADPAPEQVLHPSVAFLAAQRGLAIAAGVGCDVWLDVQRDAGPARVLTGTAEVAFDREP